MEFKAISKHRRISPLKARLVLPLIKGKKADDALDVLRYAQQKAAKLVYKTLQSAVSNAKQKNVESSALSIKEIKIDGGPTYKRGLIGSRGRMYPIRKPTSHITIVLTDEAAKLNKKQ